MATIHEGYVRFRGHRTWFRSVGEARDPVRLPLLLLHGGPGATHAVLRRLEALAEDGRQVVLYDQLGCGRSDRPREAVTWTPALFLDELAQVRRALGLARLHLLGHSWGGLLAMECVLGGDRGVRSLVLASSPVSTRQWSQEAFRLRAQLPEEVRRTLDLHEASDRTGGRAYAGALLEYERRHLCRLEPWPPCVVETMLALCENPAVQEAMLGRDRFHVTGCLRDWDVTGRLDRLRLPVLITSGRYDEVTPAIVRTAYRAIPGARWVLFGESAHLAHVEQADAYLDVLARFLDEVERG